MLPFIRSTTIAFASLFSLLEYACLEFELGHVKSDVQDPVMIFKINPDCQSISPLCFVHNGKRMVEKSLF